MKRVREAPQRHALLFGDEGTFYRQSRDKSGLWAHLERRQPRLPYSHRSNTRMRVVAYLDATTGAVHSEEMARVSAARLEVLWLPAYAPWLNPMEKGWRWTRQRVTHAHPWCDDFQEFRAQVTGELARLAEGSPEFLRYVGLSR